MRLMMDHMKPATEVIDTHVPAPPSATVPMTKDWAGMGLGFLLCLGLCGAVSYHRILWEDEMLGWMLLTDPSWHHMLRAWMLGADGGGFAFYLTGRGWMAIFGSSPLAFRMYSASCFGFAFAVVWVTARRFFSFPIVAFALCCTWFTSPPFVVHMGEGRFYGLLVLATSLAVWLTVRLDEAKQPSPGLYLLAFAIHALLVTSHLLGLVYSAFFLLATVALDRLSRRWRPGLYLSIACAWLLLLPELPAIQAAAAVGKPHFWTTPPTFRRFMGVYTGFSGVVAGVLLLLFAALAVSAWRKGGVFRRIAAAARDRRSLYAVTLALLLAPFAFLAEDLVGPSLFINRYLLPVTIGVAFLLAELLSLLPWPVFLSRRSRGRRLLMRWGSPAFGGALLAWAFFHLARFPIQQPDYTQALTGRLPKGVPVLCEDAWSFTELIGRQHASGVSYMYLLDWPYSISPIAPRLEVTQFHLMENWRKAGYFSGSIAYRDEFLATHREFIVLDTKFKQPDLTTPPEIGNPLVARFSKMPGYSVLPFATLDREWLTETAWLACKGPCQFPLTRLGR